MPRFDKTCVTQFAGTKCEKQLRFSLHPTATALRAEREVLNLPHPQVRPNLAAIQRAGDEWGQAKVRDLELSFGEGLVRGGSRTLVPSATGESVRFGVSELATHLARELPDGAFLVECEFDADTSALRRAYALEAATAVDAPGPLVFARVRPDIIEVITHGLPGAQVARQRVTVEGTLENLPVGDARVQLRIVDVKLTSEPGPHYFAELAYYAVALAAWLVEEGLEDRFVVHPAAGVWPGSETAGPLAVARAAGASEPLLRAAFGEELETVPLSIFLTEVRRLLAEVLPRVLSTPYPELEWAVTPRCQGCENLGQRFFATPGTRPSDWDERHCLPLAEATGDLSRIPYVSKGSTRVLRQRGLPDVASVAQAAVTDSAFDAHHRLRGQRGAVSARANALVHHEGSRVANPDASSIALPRWAKLRVFLTADFDPGSAITVAFGLRWAWLDRDGQLESVERHSVHLVRARSIEAEWETFAAVLEDLARLLSEAESRDRDAAFQVYVWDSVTLEHLKRVVGRHLGRIIGHGHLAALAWLFPPESIIPSPTLTFHPAVSVVGDAVRALVAMDVAHVYTLLETARRYHRDDTAHPEFWVPPFWADPFTNQIPPERAHELWRGQHRPGAATEADLISQLTRTVRTKLNALSTVVDRLMHDLHDRLPRSAPRVRDLARRLDVPGTSHLGLLLYVHARLNAALEELETSRTRALPVVEREARFASARLERRLQGDERRAALESFGVDPAGRAQVFRLAPTSRDVQAKVGDFGWAIYPQHEAGLLDSSAGAVIRQRGSADLNAAWEENRRALATSMNRVLGVTIRAIDRDRGLLVVTFDGFGDSPTLRHTMLTDGAFSVDRDQVLDPVARDVFTPRLAEAVKAIGNPPQAQADDRIRSALGITRTPRRGSLQPAGDFLWDAHTLSGMGVQRPVEAARAALLERGVVLNDSQWQAWTHALSRRLTLIWGPPGTGKSQTVRAIVAGLLVAAERSGSPLRIVVCAGTYTAIDTVVVDLAAQEGSPLRYLQSAGRSWPDWLPADVAVDTNDEERMGTLTARLSEQVSTVVAGTPQQVSKLLRKATGGAAGPLFDVIVLDEAGQLDVAHALLTLAGAAPGACLVVAGDPLQLPPIHQCPPPLGLEPLVGSVFAFFQDWHQVAPDALTINYRSNAEIVDLARLAGYPASLQPAHPHLRVAWHQAPSLSARPGGWPSDLEWGASLLTLADPQRPVTCFTYPEGVSGQWNQFEVEVVTALVRLYATHLAGQDGGAIDAETFWSRTVGVVTPHRAQRARIVRALIEAFTDVDADARLPEWIALAVDTVERFQGQERSIIIGSFAVGDPDTVAEEAEFLHNVNRFNVLATRAKAKLIVLASREVLDHVAAELDVIRSSALLKTFADTFCNQSEPGALSWSDEGQRKVVTGEVRWR